MAFKTKIDPVPWNIYIRAATDLDVDELIAGIKQELSKLLPAAVEQLQAILKRIHRRGRDEPSTLNLLAKAAPPGLWYGLPARHYYHPGDRSN